MKYFIGVGLLACLGVFALSGVAIAKPVCGNNVLEGKEACDGTDLKGATCATLGFVSGTLACTNTCTLNTTGCTTGNQCVADLQACNSNLTTCNGNLTTSQADLTASQASLGTCNTSLAASQASLGTCNTSLAACLAQQGGCGDGQVAGSEECDVGMLNGATCQSAGFAGGTLSCGTGCTLDTSACYATRFVDNGETITDQETGLEWEKKTDDDGVHDKDNVYTWSSLDGGTRPDGTAFTEFLETLNNCVGAFSPATGGFAGHCDWRLPTVEEFQTILLNGCNASPCVIDPIFSDTTVAPYYYWSSITSANNPLSAIIANFAHGGLGAVTKGHCCPFVHVRAVRSAQ